jgi:hypothetical protein
MNLRGLKDWVIWWGIETIVEDVAWTLMIHLHLQALIAHAVLILLKHLKQMVVFVQLIECVMLRHLVWKLVLHLTHFGFRKLYFRLRKIPLHIDKVLPTDIIRWHHKVTQERTCLTTLFLNLLECWRICSIIKHLRALPSQTVGILEVNRPTLRRLEWRVHLVVWKILITDCH